ncbi:hypothetical protein BRADI_1g47021v3 [Brachypodium distachyon]|uniref:Uncharacterized protein n=1 Tax=Brachypodium distachyon TaxID=15368 RepID=A0A0Q3H873_BRADI|nr:hypothetical protein BRADI_1g47021v3 [Brachypodium distachyon]
MKERNTSLPRDLNTSWGESPPRLLPTNDPTPYPAADASTTAPLSACTLIQSPDPARLPAALQIGAAAPSPPRYSSAAAEAFRLPRQSRSSSAAEGETGGRQVPCSACGPPRDVAVPRRSMDVTDGRKRTFS